MTQDERDRDTGQREEAVWAATNLKVAVLNNGEAKGTLVMTNRWTTGPQDESKTHRTEAEMCCALLGFQR